MLSLVFAVVVLRADSMEKRDKAWGPRERVEGEGRGHGGEQRKL